MHELEVQPKFYCISSTHARLIDVSPVSCTFAFIISVKSFGRASFTNWKRPKICILSLQNFRCKYSCMPSEFQFTEPPFPSEFQKAIRRGVWMFSGIAHLKKLPQDHGEALQRASREQTQPKVCIMFQGKDKVSLAKI